jgi:hypothetical protein
MHRMALETETTHDVNVVMMVDASASSEMEVSPRDGVFIF